MAASTNDSQGLKIAVAVFIALSVILAVMSYFLYSNGSVAEARLAQVTEKNSTLERAQSTQLTQIGDLRNMIGVRVEEPDAIKNQVEKQYKDMYERLDKLGGSVRAAVQKLQQAGAQPQEIQDLHDKVNQAVMSFKGEKNMNYISSLDRMTELMENLALLTTEMGSNYLELRHSLESATSVTKKQVEVQTQAAEASRADLMDEGKKHVEERQSLLTKVESLTKDNDLKTTEIANLNATIGRMKDDYSKEKDQLRSIISELHDKAERVNTILDHPDGYITYVDYTSREVRLNINRSMGARPQMVLSVFDSRSPGIPTEKPKGTIEVVKVGDTFSIARIVRTVSLTDPIHDGDIVYSAAWSPNNPTRFALIGKIDVNRDGRDDREELKRMIQEAGGIVDFDLPPPYIGKETGKITPRIEWYVTDDRLPFRDVYLQRSEPIMKMETELAQRKGEVIKEARADGIRPMPIERLLNFLGYDINTPVVGRAEAVNQRALNRVTAKKPQLMPGAVGAAGATPKEEMKEEEPADDTPKDTPKKKATPKKADDDAGDQ